MKRYNELVAAGKDEDFGKPANYLVPVDTPPFYGIHRHVRMSAICSGVDVNAKHECLTPEGEVIENLYAIGNCSGHFYGGIDYPLTVFGLSLGRCYTEGYVDRPHGGREVAGSRGRSRPPPRLSCERLRWSRLYQSLRDTIS